MTNEVQQMVERLREYDDPRLFREVDVLMSNAADLIERLANERDSESAQATRFCERLVACQKIADAARNLVVVKGRLHSEQAYIALCDAIDEAMKGVE